eukprot:2018944-Rhodomonas_salina.3
MASEARGPGHMEECQRRRLQRVDYYYTANCDRPTLACSVGGCRAEDGAMFADCCISKDFGRLPRQLMVTLTWKERNELLGLAGVLRECTSLRERGDWWGCFGRAELAHLDLSDNRIRAQEAQILAKVFGKCHKGTGILT